MTTLRTTLSCLSQRDHDFLKKLVHFGGACTRWQAQIALGMKDKENTRVKLQKLVKRELLVTQELSGTVPNGPTVYMPTRRLAQLFGCDRREPRDTEQLVEKCYRFFVSVSESGAQNYLSAPAQLPVDGKTLAAIENAHRDEIYLPETHTIVIDLQATWPRMKTRNRILFWAQSLPKANIELRATFPKTCELAKADLPITLQKRVTKMVQKYEPLSAMYAYCFKLTAEDNNDDSIA